MFFRLGKAFKKGGSKYTIISIFIIGLMVIMLRATAPERSEEYPEIVFYNSYEYNYVKTISDNPLSYIRKKEMSYEGYILLLKRKNKKDNPPNEVFIYTGFRKYRKYVNIRE